MASTRRDFDMIDCICHELKDGKISYKSLPRKMKREHSIIVNSKFEDIFSSAPKGYWRNKNFVKSVLRNLDMESSVEFNEEHYRKFAERIKKYNNPDSKVMSIVTINFTVNPYSEIILKML